MDEVQQAVELHIGTEVHGAAWLVDRAGDVTSGVAGRYGPHDQAIGPDTIFRISSVTKPVVAALAMILVEDGTLRLDDSVDALLPELADRRVLRFPGAALDDTVPAERPTSVRDVLEFRTGLGMDFSGPFPGTVLGALAERGLPVGPPAPQQAPPPDEWMRLVGSVPLSHQPGSRWLYNTSAQLLGVLLSRATGAPLDRLLAERLLDPLGMRDTGFVVRDLERFGPQWMPDEQLYDPADGQWSTLPAFPDAAAGLVSTIADLHAFANMLRSGGFPVLRPETVVQMTTPHVDGLDEAGREGWGLGLGVARADLPDGRHAGTYGWDGGMGSTWWTDPVTDTIAVLLTTDAWSSPQPTPIFTDFWRAAFR